MTTRKSHKENKESPKSQIGALKVNLVIAPVNIQPTATFGVQPVFFGGPIMREDFITQTDCAPLKHGR